MLLYNLNSLVTGEVVDRKAFLISLKIRISDTKFIKMIKSQLFQLQNHPEATK